MKSSKTLTYILILIAGILISSCSSSSPTNPIVNINTNFTCTINGGGFTNQTVTIALSGGAVYSSAENATGVVFSSTTNDVCGIKFAGSSTGTKTIDETNNTVTISISGKTPFDLNSGTINVTSFGSVGGEVKGTFSGSGINLTTLETIQVTNGSFLVKRIY